MDKQGWRAERFRLANKRRSMHQCTTKHGKKPYINSRSIKKHDINDKFNSAMANVCFGNGWRTFVTTILILIGALSIFVSFISVCGGGVTIQIFFTGQWIEKVISLAVGILAVFIGDLIFNLFVKRTN